MSMGRSSIVRFSPGLGQPVGTFLKMRALFWTMIVVLSVLRERYGCGIQRSLGWADEEKLAYVEVELICTKESELIEFKCQADMAQ